MRMIAPKVDAPQVVIAEEQEEFKPITAALVRHPAYPCHPHGFNSVLLCFRPSDDERKRIAGGEDLYVSLLTLGGPMQGIIVSAGAEEPSLIYNVRRTP